MYCAIDCMGCVCVCVYLYATPSTATAFLRICMDLCANNVVCFFFVALACVLFTIQYFSAEEHNHHNSYSKRFLTAATVIHVNP